MNREDIIRMALETGLPHWYHTDGIVNEERIIAFAALVASVEREACAKVCDGINAVYNKSEDKAERVASQWCAEVIRARGQA